MMAWHRLRLAIRLIRSKTGRMVIMLFLTVGIAVAEIVYGIRTRSQLLIADGLFSFAEGIALVGSLLALRYAKAERLHVKNTFGWARLELLAGLLQEVLLLSLSLSIIIDAINKLINPNHIEDPSAMIYLGAAGCLIGLLGLVLFRGYHHDHNIGDEIVEQKKNDFVQSVYDTLRNRDLNNGNLEQFLNEQRPNSGTVPALVISETSSSLQREKFALILPSLNETYKNAFVVADNTTTTSSTRRTEDPFDDHSPTSESQLRVPENAPHGLRRMRSQSGDSFLSSTVVLNEGETILEDDFQESRVYATLHALCLHSLAVLLESAIVLISGLLNKFVPHRDRVTGERINVWLKYIDPSLTLLIVVIIAIKAIPVIWSLGHILVEAVPSGINTHQLIQTIMKTIPQIRGVHSVHVWRATARDVFATLHVVCDEDLSLSICTDVFGRHLQRIFATHCIRHYTLQYEYVEPGGDFNRCTYGTRRRHRGHHSSSDDKGNLNQSQTDIQLHPSKTEPILRNSVGDEL